MIPVAAQLIGHADFTSSIGGTVISNNEPDAVNKDKGGMSTVRVIGKKVAITAKAMKAIKTSLEQEIDTALKNIYNE